MTQLSNGMGVTISINNIPMPLEHFAQPSMQLDESEEFGIPIVMMMLVDSTGGNIIKHFTPVPDGALISVSISNPQNEITREFRSSGSTSEGPNLILRGYLNHPNYIIERSKSSMNSTSSEALKSIADTCGFKYNGVTTADKMVWLGCGQRLINFARHILSASFMDEYSMMAGRITMDGEMRVVNLSNRTPSKAIFGYGTGAIPLYGFKPLSSSLENIHGGYKQTQMNSPIGSPIEYINDMPFKMDEVSLNRNPKLAELSKVGALMRIPMSHKSNIHQNYSRAIYNNNRAMKLYTMQCKILTNNLFTNIDALDTITLANKNPIDGTVDGSLAEMFDGDWVVSSKSFFIDNGQIYEMFNLMRTGLGYNMHGATI